MNTPFIIGIAGGSCSGKTTVARTLAERLGPDRCVTLYQDNYYRGVGTGFSDTVNFDHPDAIDFDLMADQLASLKSGQTIAVPIYDFHTHERRSETQELAPRPVIIVEGILILHHALVRSALDHSVYIECPEHFRRDRRMVRDVSQRGRDEEEIRAQLTCQVLPMHDKFVSPSKEHASLKLDQEASLAEIKGHTTILETLCLQRIGGG